MASLPMAMNIVEVILIIVALWGNGVLWVKVLDRLLSRKIVPRLKTNVKLPVLLLFLLLPCWLATWYLQGDQRLVDLLWSANISLPLLYVIFCWA
ncbi:MAG: hypothetical protein GTO53_08655, partial [Planctomycetales bacterium]|nr:hypothetical protein [Planctomycetales bacterium]NIM09197.1 hypothetical protein [Planctomycetales bacterium]NIN08673.1 hypothetical protein [Planctomycetales bacterium]NIN77792.1 hypothetical protein [Planctomycetales bacterium]NIO34969.1 hypothetical protein [Planctomycetales bacterium]